MFASERFGRATTYFKEVLSVFNTFGNSDLHRNGEDLLL